MGNQIMKIKLRMKTNARAFIFVTILLAASCTSTYEQPIHEIELWPAKEKIDLAVQLILTDDFRDAKWKKKARETRLSFRSAIT